MARVPTSVTFTYSDDQEDGKEVEIKLEDGLTMGQLLDRMTNGAVQPEDYVISRNGDAVSPGSPASAISDGDRVAASPRKSVGA